MQDPEIYPRDRSQDVRLTWRLCPLSLWARVSNHPVNPSSSAMVMQVSCTKVNPSLSITYFLPRELFPVLPFLVASRTNHLETDGKFDSKPQSDPTSLGTQFGQMGCSCSTLLGANMVLCIKYGNPPAFWFICFSSNLQSFLPGTLSPRLVLAQKFVCPCTCQSPSHNNTLAHTQPIALPWSRLVYPYTARMDPSDVMKVVIVGDDVVSAALNFTVRSLFQYRTLSNPPTYLLTLLYN